MSSPSRLVIDPAMYNYEPDARKNSGVLPPPSKLLPTSSTPGFSGWTPVVSRTFSNDMGLHNLTPSSKILPMYKSGSGRDEYPGLNLTPFLAHIGNPGSATSANMNLTPYYDKSMHLSDFFMDSPIRQTPLKVQTITPSKFLGPTFDATLNTALSLKRSISQIDTPARHPYKKYDATKYDAQISFDAKYDDKYDDDKYDGAKSDDDSDAADYVDSNYKQYDSFVTPSKKNVLKEMPATLLNRTPRQCDKKNVYQTPKPNLVSSPSTVIMSSSTRSPDNNKQSPPSPTPVKEIEVAEPVMGIFSERKASKPKQPKKQLAGMSKFQIVFTDVHTLMNNRKKGSGNSSSRDKKRPPRKQPAIDATNNAQHGSSQHSGTQHSGAQLNSTQNNSTQNNSTQHNSTQHTNTQHNNTQHNSIQHNTNIHKHEASPAFQSHSFASFQHTLSSLSQDYNSTINTSREFSVQGNNTSINTSNSLNVTDQASFDLIHGGLMSTPNCKFLLDNLFDRTSPLTVGQMAPTLNQGHMDKHMRPMQPMPPPKTITLQQAAQQALRPDNHMVNMMMSTPQRDNMVYAEFSPSNKDSMTYMYQQLHQFHHINSLDNNLLGAGYKQDYKSEYQGQNYKNGNKDHEYNQNYKDYQNDASNRRRNRSNRNQDT